MEKRNDIGGVGVRWKIIIKKKEIKYNGIFS